MSYIAMQVVNLYTTNILHSPD